MLQSPAGDTLQRLLKRQGFNRKLATTVIGRFRVPFHGGLPKTNGVSPGFFVIARQIYISASKADFWAGENLVQEVGLFLQVLVGYRVHSSLEMKCTNLTAEPLNSYQAHKKKEVFFRFFSFLT